MSNLGNVAGSFAGKINFPTYMKNFHQDYLLDNAEVLIPLLLVGASPYNTAYAYDPDSAIEASQEELTDLGELVAAIDPETEVETFLAASADAVDAEMLPDSYITSRATEFEVSTKPSYFRSVNSFTGGMSDINAVHNSSFIIGLALMEAQFQNQIDSFVSTLEAQRDQIRNSAVLETMRGMLALRQLRISAGGSIVGMQIEQGRFEITSKQAQYDKDIELDVRDLLWDFDVLDRGGMVLGAMSGTPAAPNPPSMMQQAASTGISALSALMPILGML